MSDELKGILRELQNEFELTGHVVIEDWFSDYPEYRAEIEAFAQSLDANAIHNRTEPVGWPRGGAVVRRLVRESTAKFMEARQERRLGELRAAATRTFADRTHPAVVRPRMYADLVKRLSASANDLVDVVKLAKSAHIEVRYFGLSGFSFVAEAKGPLDEDFYRALGVAKSEGWIAPVGEYHLRPGPRIAADEDGFQDHLPDADLVHQLVRVLAPYSGWELGVWSTVLWSSERLLGRGEPIGLASVKRRILEEPKWAGKLDWREYSDERIVDALEHLSRLGLLPGPNTGI